MNSHKILIKSVFLSLAFLATYLTNSFGMMAMQRSEWDIPRIIIMHTPGDETFCGQLHANAALFEAPFDIYAAQAEHKNYIATLQGNEIRVIEIVDVLLQGTLNEDGSKKDGPELDELIAFAKKSLTYYMPTNWTSEDHVEQEKYKENTLRNLHPKTLVRIILERPEIHLRNSTEHNTKFVADPYQTHPLMNMHFLRDQQITTAKGIVLGRMNSIQREYEVNVMDFVFRKLGITPIYRVSGSGRLEGGDYMPAGDFALIGQGLRTNAEGVRQLLEHDVFGVDEVAVVKDPFQHQDQMHLDTYFNILGNKIAIVDGIRREKGFISRGDIYRNIRPTVDIYKKLNNGKYVCVQKDKDFFEYIEDEKGFVVIDIEDAEQLNYGCNFLCIGNNKIIGVKGVSERYLDLLTQAGIDATLLEFRNVTKSYGGPHCTTQVIYRSLQN